MKKRICIAILYTMASGAFGQGVVSFYNNMSTLISGPVGDPTPLPFPLEPYYFALLTAPVGSTQLSQFTFSGVYGTNQPVASGRFTGGVAAVPGWAPGTQRAFMVVGWSSYFWGHDFQSSWLGLTQPLGGLGWSMIASGSPGGFNPQTGQTSMSLPIFSSTTISQGFEILIPEPNTLALAGLGTGALLIFRRRKYRVTRNLGS